MKATHHDLTAYLSAIWRWKWMLLPILIGLPVGAYVVADRQEKVYESTALVLMRDVTINADALDVSLPAANGQAVFAAARIIRTPAITRAAARRLRPTGSPQEMAVAVTPDPQSGFVDLRASAHSPQRAADIANAVAQAAIAPRAQEARRHIKAAIASAQRRLAALPRRDAVNRAPMESTIERLRSLAATQLGASVIQPAEPVATPVSPRVRRAVAMAAVIALMLAIGAVIVAEAFDKRIREPEDLERTAGVALLSSVPASAFENGRHDFAVDEAFHTLRAALTYFNVDRPLSSVMVASPAQADGKTTVATRLATAVAQTGKTTIIVDADLRRPRVARQLGTTEPGIGLSSLLSGQASLDDVLIEIPLDAPSAGRLLLLPAGPTPPNPSELIGSQRMRDVLAELGERADLTIIDTNPVLTVSDSLPLMKAVSGVVVVGRVNVTTHDVMARLVTVIRSAGGTLLGVVATGTRAPGLYGNHGFRGYHARRGYGAYAKAAFDTKRAAPAESGGTD